MHRRPPAPDIPLDDATQAKLAGWVGEYWDPVFGMLYRLTYNRHEAEDLTQETFLRAARRYTAFQQGTNLRAWLMRIAVNTHLDMRRRARVARPQPLGDLDVATALGPEQCLARQELSGALESALKMLPETARFVFLLRTREDLSFSDIARALQTTEETARWHMLQARRQLMKSLEAWL